VFLAIWVAFEMIYLGEWAWLITNLICSPWCLAALVYCGMPADGTEVRKGKLFRRGNRHYQVYHTLWHFLSAGGEFHMPLMPLMPLMAPIYLLGD
jgi:hypothetical protein